MLSDSPCSQPDLNWQLSIYDIALLMIDVLGGLVAVVISASSNWEDTMKRRLTIEREKMVHKIFIKAILSFDGKFSNREVTSDSI